MATATTTEIINGATYWFDGTAYLATLEDDSEYGIVADFQRLPVAHEDDEPVFYLHASGALLDPDGDEIGERTDLERAEVQPVTADDVRELLTSGSMEPTLVRWSDTLTVEVVAGVLFSDISYCHYGREHEVLTTASDLRFDSGPWDHEHPTDADYEAFAQMLNEDCR